MFGLAKSDANSLLVCLASLNNIYAKYQWKKIIRSTKNIGNYNHFKQIHTNSVTSEKPASRKPAYRLIELPSVLSCFFLSMKLRCFFSVKNLWLVGRKISNSCFKLRTPTCLHLQHVLVLLERFYLRYTVTNRKAQSPVWRFIIFGNCRAATIKYGLA